MHTTREESCTLIFRRGNQPSNVMDRTEKTWGHASVNKIVAAGYKVGTWRFTPTRRSYCSHPASFFHRTENYCCSSFLRRLSALTNGGVGDCTNSLASGSTCQPTCNAGYTVSGTSSCSAGILTSATCSKILLDESALLRIMACISCPAERSTPPATTRRATRPSAIPCYAVPTNGCRTIISASPARPEPSTPPGRRQLREIDATPLCARRTSAWSITRASPVRRAPSTPLGTTPAARRRSAARSRATRTSAYCQTCASTARRAAPTRRETTPLAKTRCATARRAPPIKGSTARVSVWRARPARPTTPGTILSEGRRSAT